MTIVSVGLSYRVTPVELLEKLVVPAADLGDVLARLRADGSVDEVLLLSTCNRLEAYAATRGPVAVVSRAVAEQLATLGGVPVHEVLRTACVRIDTAAVEHLFTVACGLDSMAIGEDQIVAQLRAAQRSATSAGASGPALTRLVDAALRVSKRARSETRIGGAGASLARAGIDLAADRLGMLRGRHAVVLGTGGAGKLAVRLLHEAGVRAIGVAGRNAPAAARLAASVGGRPMRIEDLPGTLAGTDLLVTATSCPVPVVLAEHVRSRPRHRPLFVLDLGMPPDVDPAVGRAAHVTLVDVEALGRHLADRQLPDEVPRVRAIVAAEVAGYVEGLPEVAAAPVIRAMRTRVEQLAAAELDRLHGQCPGLDDQLRDEMARTVHRILDKVLHGPTVRVRELSKEPDGPIYLEALRRLYEPTGLRTS